MSGSGLVLISMPCWKRRRRRRKRSKQRPRTQSTFWPRAVGTFLGALCFARLAPAPPPPPRRRPWSPGSGCRYHNSLSLSKVTWPAPLDSSTHQEILTTLARSAALVSLRNITTLALLVLDALPVHLCRHKLSAAQGAPDQKMVAVLGQVLPLPKAVLQPTVVDNLDRVLVQALGERVLGACINISSSSRKRRRSLPVYEQAARVRRRPEGSAQMRCVSCIVSSRVKQAPRALASRSRMALSRPR